MSAANGLPRGAGKLGVFYGAQTVSVQPTDENYSAARVVLGPFQQTPETIARCKTFAAAQELHDILFKIVRYHQDGDYAEQLDQQARDATDGNVSAMDGLINKAGALLTTVAA